MVKKRRLIALLGALLCAGSLLAPAAHAAEAEDGAPGGGTSLAAQGAGGQNAADEEAAARLAAAQRDGAGAAQSAAGQRSPAGPTADGKAGPSGTTGLYLHEESFSSEHHLVGLFAQCNEYFYAGDWDFRGARFTLRYSATGLVEQSVSSITVSLNGRPVSSARIERSLGGEAQQLQIDLPLDNIKAGQNVITIDTYVRTQDSMPCVDDVSKANWLNVYKDSFVSISYLPKIPCNTVADLYEQFTSIDALENRQSAVLLGQGADELEWTLAALALTGISANAPLSYENIGLRTIGESGFFADKYEILVSRFENLPGSLADRLSQEQRSAAQQGALLALLKGENGSNLLLLTGSDDEALLRAGKLLGNQGLMLQTRAGWRKVSATEDVLKPPAAVDEYQKLDTAGRYLKGPFRQSTSYSVAFPANRTLAGSSELLIKMRYAENLDFDRSLVSAYINGTPIGSKKLQKDQAQGDEAVFALPAGLEISGNFTLEISFDLEIKDLWCTLRQSETPWAWVSEESMLKLASVENDRILFESYPSPFIKDGSMNRVVAVIPDEPGEADVSAARDILLTLGRYQKDNRGELSVQKMSRIGDLSDSNVIAIGSLQKNRIVQQLGSKLFFQFSPEGTTLRSNEKLVIEPNYGATLGTVQLLDSPYSQEKRALMVVTGVSDEAMLRGVEYIGSVEGLWSIYGDGYVADGVEVFPFRFKEDNAVRRPIVEQALQRGDLLNFALVAALVLILTGISAIFLIRKHRGGKPDEK